MNVHIGKTVIPVIFFLLLAILAIWEDLPLLSQIHRFGIATVLLFLFYLIVSISHQCTKAGGGFLRELLTRFCERFGFSGYPFPLAFSSIVGLAIFACCLRINPFDIINDVIGLKSLKAGFYVIVAGTVLMLLLRKDLEGEHWRKECGVFGLLKKFGRIPVLGTILIAPIATFVSTALGISVLKRIYPLERPNDKRRLAQLAIVGSVVVLPFFDSTYWIVIDDALDRDFDATTLPLGLLVFGITILLTSFLYTDRRGGNQSQPVMPGLRRRIRFVGFFDRESVGNWKLWYPILLVGLLVPALVFFVQGAGNAGLGPREKMIGIFLICGFVIILVQGFVNHVSKELQVSSYNGLIFGAKEIIPVVFVIGCVTAFTGALGEVIGDILPAGKSGISLHVFVIAVVFAAGTGSMFLTGGMVFLLGSGIDGPGTVFFWVQFAAIAGCLTEMWHPLSFTNQELNDLDWKDSVIGKIKPWQIHLISAALGLIVAFFTSPVGWEEDDGPAELGFEPAVELGDYVEAGESLGEVTNILGGEWHQVLASETGIVIVLRTFPRVHKGDSVGVVMNLKQDSRPGSV